MYVLNCFILDDRIQKHFSAHRHFNSIGQMRETKYRGIYVDFFNTQSMQRKKSKLHIYM